MRWFSTRARLLTYGKKKKTRKLQTFYLFPRKMNSKTPSSLMITHFVYVLIIFLITQINVFPNAWTLIGGKRMFFFSYRDKMWQYLHSNWLTLSELEFNLFVKYSVTQPYKTRWNIFIVYHSYNACENNIEINRTKSKARPTLTWIFVFLYTGQPSTRILWTKGVCKHEEDPRFHFYMK